MVRLETLAVSGRIASCDHCRLQAQKGLGIGNPQARIVLLAQNPGKVTDLNLTLVPFEWHLWNKGTPSKGAAILRRALREVKIPLYDLYVTNAMKCQGVVQDLYLAKCRPWFDLELQQLPRAELIVAMGLVAGTVIGNIEAKIVKNLPGDYRKAYVTAFVNHPSSLLYPGGMSFDAYVDQWAFVEAVYRRLKETPK